MNWLRRSVVTALCAGVALALPAMADEIKLKAETRELGIAVGQAYVCTPEDQKALARADSETIYDMILFGIDHEHAYVYAVAVGYGASTKKKDIDCKKIDARLADVRTKVGLGETK